MYRKVAFLIGTMCRVSEFAGLTWEDIDMKNRIIVIDHQLQYKKIGGDNFDFHITSTKNTHTIQEKSPWQMMSMMYWVNCTNTFSLREKIIVWIEKRISCSIPNQANCWTLRHSIMIWKGLSKSITKQQHIKLTGFPHIHCATLAVRGTQRMGWILKFYNTLWGIPIHRLQTMFTIMSMKNVQRARLVMWMKGAETGHKRQKIHTPIFVLRKRIFTPILHQSCVEICEFIIGYVKWPLVVKSPQMPKNKDLQTCNKLHQVCKTSPQSYNNVRIKREM